MRKISILFFLLLITVFVNSQNLYVRTFGNVKNQPILFLHGGPGYNCANFEITTAERMANNNFFVIVYDRRGEGRSSNIKAKYTFKETFKDLQHIYSKFKLKKTILIGHSFGGILATLFAELYPSKVKSVILVGAPVSLQETYTTIIESSKQIYQLKKDTVNLQYIYFLEKMNKASLEYSSYSFMHAMQNGFYTTKNPTEEAKLIYMKFRTDSTLIKYASKMTYPAPKGFWENENYTTLDLKSNIRNLVLKNVQVFGLYGKEDGLYSVNQVKELENILGENHIKYVDSCSHNVFIDQQTLFVNSITSWSKEH